MSDDPPDDLTDPPLGGTDSAAEAASSLAMASALAAAEASMAADPLIRDVPPGHASRRDRMRDIIHAVAAEYGVERMELTMGLASRSRRPN